MKFIIAMSVVGMVTWGIKTGLFVQWYRVTSPIVGQVITDLRQQFFGYQPIRYETLQPTANKTQAQQKLLVHASPKEKAWLAWYREKEGCNNWKDKQHMVDCGNHKIRARREFEKLWVAGKITGKAESPSLEMNDKGN